MMRCVCMCVSLSVRRLRLRSAFVSNRFPLVESEASFHSALTRRQLNSQSGEMKEGGVEGRMKEGGVGGLMGRREVGRRGEKETKICQRGRRGEEELNLEGKIFVKHIKKIFV